MATESGRGGRRVRVELRPRETRGRLGLAATARRGRRVSPGRARRRAGRLAAGPPALWARLDQETRPAELGRWVRVPNSLGLPLAGHLCRLPGEDLAWPGKGLLAEALRPGQSGGRVLLRLGLAGSGLSPGWLSAHRELWKAGGKLAAAVRAGFLAALSGPAAAAVAALAGPAAAVRAARAQLGGDGAGAAG